MSTVETLQELLRIPSYSGQERSILEFIQNHLLEQRIESFFQGENLVVHLQGKDSTRAFIFNSHVDVVDVGDESRWTHSPWGGEEEDGRIYGRGASDMKAGVAASIETLKSLAQRPQLPCDVWFTYVVREEVDGQGTKDFADWFQSEGYPDHYEEITAVFTEPTNLNIVEHGHRGNYFIKATLDGDAGHASRPHEIQTHAIVEMTSFISKLQEESSVWRERFGNSEFAAPTITPTAIEAKSASPNKISDHCEAIFDLRTIPGFHQEAFERVREIAAKRGIQLSLLFPDAPSGYTSLEAKIIRVLKELVPGLKLEVSQGSADLGFLTAIGVEGIIFGPGEKEQGHRIDESVPVENVKRAPKLYEQLYDAWAAAEHYSHWLGNFAAKSGLSK